MTACRILTLCLVWMSGLEFVGVHFGGWTGTSGRRIGVKCVECWSSLTRDACYFFRVTDRFEAF